MDGLAPSDLLGWIAALITLAAMSMRTMRPLRAYAAIASCVFLAGALLSGAPILGALAFAIFCVNVYRLVQLRRGDAAARQARNGAFSLDWIRSAMRPVKFSDGEVIFRKGDEPHYIYYLKTGNVRLQEIDVTLGAGEIFGEIAFFSDTKERTLTAVCEGDCEIMVIRETDFAKLHHQNPALGLYMLQLVASRLLEGVESNPEAYRRISALERKRRDG